MLVKIDKETWQGDFNNLLSIGRAYRQIGKDNIQYDTTKSHFADFGDELSYFDDDLIKGNIKKVQDIGVREEGALSDWQILNMEIAVDEKKVP